MNFPKQGAVLFSATLVRGHIAKFHIPYLRWFKEQGWETWVAAKNDCFDGICEIPHCDNFVNIDFEPRGLRLRPEICPLQGGIRSGCRCGRIAVCVRWRPRENSGAAWHRSGRLCAPLGWGSHTQKEPNRDRAGIRAAPASRQSLCVRRGARERAAARTGSRAWGFRTHAAFGFSHEHPEHHERLRLLGVPLGPRGLAGVGRGSHGGKAACCGEPDTWYRPRPYYSRKEWPVVRRHRSTNNRIGSIRTYGTPRVAPANYAGCSSIGGELRYSSARSKNRVAL